MALELLPMTKLSQGSAPAQPHWLPHPALEISDLLISYLEQLKVEYVFGIQQYRYLQY